MTILLHLLNSAAIWLVALFLAVLWMLKDQKDKTRPILVFALVINLIYGWLLSVVLGKEDGLLPWKYDLILFHMDQALGLSAAAVALPLQGLWRTPLQLIYELLCPMMIFWYLMMRQRNHGGSLIEAYAAEMVAGPMMYAILPACGPIYAFHAAWLHPPSVQAIAMRFSGMPNAFPSLHVATAFVFVLFARGRLWKMISLAFLLGTALATISTGEHYLIGLVSGLAFGCFAANVGYRRIMKSLLYLGGVLAWSLAIRFDSAFLIDHPGVVQSFAALTVALAIHAVFTEWSGDRMPVSVAAVSAD